MRRSEIKEGETYFFVASRDATRCHLNGQPFTVTEKKSYRTGKKTMDAVIYFVNSEGQKAYAEELEPMPDSLPDRILIEAAAVEFAQGGNTIWVQSPQGGTVLRIKCTGQIITESCQNSPISHGDIIVVGDMHICVSTDLIKE